MHFFPRLTALLLLCCSSAFCLQAQERPGFPATPVKTTTKHFFGNTVSDNYAWLEQTDHADVQRWIRAQTAFTDSFIGTIPFLAALEQNIRNNSMRSVLTPPSRRKYSFSLFMPRLDNGNGTPVLYYREKEDRDWQELIDPARFKTSADERVVITNYQLSSDGKNLAFFIARNGSDWNELRIIDMDSRKLRRDSISWLKSNFVLWFRDGFFYHRPEKPKDAGQWAAVSVEEQFCYHQLNTAATEDIALPVGSCLKAEVIDDNLIIHGKEFNGRSEFYNIAILKLTEAGWQQKKPARFMLYPASIRYDIDVVGMHNDSVIVRSNLFANNGLLAIYDRNELNGYRVLVPEYDEVLTNAFSRLGKLHCLYRDDTGYIMVRFDLQGKPEASYKFNRFMSIGHFRSEDASTAFYTEASFDMPPVQYIFDFKEYRADPAGATYVGYELNNYVRRRVSYRSSDGAEIPMDLFYKKDLKISDQTPVLLTAYGGFGRINDPEYDYTNLLWAENGGIYALAHIRGGGERGKQWHTSGSRQHKQQGIDDIVWAAKFLEENKFTSPGHLAITGGSNGGLIVGAAVNQAPGLFKAAVPVVGLFDMLNYQDYTVGAAFSDEYGTSEDSASFGWIYAYSPYHHIDPKLNYPAVLAITGDHDDRVPPFNSYKYIAALQAVPAGKNPALLYVNTNAGHNGGITLRDDAKEKAYMFAFLFNALHIQPKLLY